MCEKTKKQDREPSENAQDIPRDFELLGEEVDLKVLEQIGNAFSLLANPQARAVLEATKTSSKIGAICKSALASKAYDHLDKGQTARVAIRALVAKLQAAKLVKQTSKIPRHYEWEMNFTAIEEINNFFINKSSIAWEK